MTKLNASGTSLAWSIYLGGSTNDYGRGIALGADGVVSLIGTSDSTDFPTQDAIQASNNGDTEMVFAQFTASSGAVRMSSYLGTSAAEVGTDVATGGRVGTVYLTGATGSLSASEVFVAKLGDGTGALPGDQVFCPLCHRAHVSVGKPIDTCTGNLWTNATDLVVTTPANPRAMQRGGWAGAGTIRMPRASSRQPVRPGC